MDTAKKYYGDNITLQSIDRYWNEHCIGRGLRSTDPKDGDDKHKE